MDEIKQWLKGSGDYDAGVLLFCRYGKNRSLKNYLQRKNDPQKLRYELSKLVGIDAFAVPQKVSDFRVVTNKPLVLTNKPMDELKPNQRLKIIREGGVSYNQLPESLQPVYMDACDSYRQMRHFHEKMKLAATDADRAGIRAELLAQTERNRSCWEALDRWAADGTLPEPPKPELKSETGNRGPVDGKALNAARVGIGRDLNALEKTEQPEVKEQLLEKLRANVAVVIGAGCEFGKNAPRLKALGLIA